MPKKTPLYPANVGSMSITLNKTAQKDHVTKSVTDTRGKTWETTPKQLVNLPIILL